MKDSDSRSLFLAITVFSFILAGCANEQASVSGNRDAVDEQSTQDSLYETPPGYTPSPFEVAELPDAALPDSLGGETVSGQMVLRVTLDSTGSLMKTEIVRLRLSDLNDGTMINFHDTALSRKTEYPLEVQGYLEWATSYAERIVFRRIQPVDVEDRNLLFVPVRLD